MSTTNSKNPVQTLFLNQLKEMMSPGASFIDELAEMLEISVDSAYRRYRGDTAITIDDARKICSRYPISIDSLFLYKDHSVTFRYTPLTEHEGNFEKYLQGVLTQLTNINLFEKRELIYAAEEIPIFHSFHSKELAIFKMFYWQRSVLGQPALQAKKFDFSVVPNQLIDLSQKIRQAYLAVPSIEIWTDDTIFTAIRQVEYYHESGLFKKQEDALIILRKIREMADEIRVATELGSKNTPDEVSFKLYKSDVVIGTNCIQVTAGEIDYSYISFNTLNSLSTANATFCAETGHWLKNLMNKSTLISGTAEKQRFKFFNTMNKNIDSCIERIENSL